MSSQFVNWSPLFWYMQFEISVTSLSENKLYVSYTFLAKTYCFE